MAVINNRAATQGVASSYSNSTTPATASGTDNPSAQTASWAIMSLMRLDLGVLKHVTISNNSAPFWTLAMEFQQWNFLESVDNLTISNNTAGGIRLKTLQPYFDNQGWVMKNSRIINNHAAREVGMEPFWASKAGSEQHWLNSACTNTGPCRVPCNPDEIVFVCVAL